MNASQNILLLNPPFKSEFGRFSREQRSPAITKSGTLYYPMWLSYAAGVLEKHGFRTTLLDCPADNIPWDAVETYVKQHKPSLVVIDTSTPSIYNDIRQGEVIKELHGEAFVLLVGPHVSALPEQTLKASRTIDGVAVREYDYTVLELATALNHNTDLRSIPGLWLRHQSEIISTPVRELTMDLDALPFVSSVYKKHLKFRNYFYAHSRYPIVTIITGRGCPHHCIYCVYPQTFSGRKVRYRSVENVVEEIAFILREFPGVKEIMFEDDTLTLNKKRCFAFAEAILKRNLKFAWSANSRTDVDLETLRILKRAGARLFCVGVESGDQTIIDGMQKKNTLDQTRQFFKDAKQAGILLHGCFMVGNPGETRESMEKSLALAKELEPDTAQFFPLMVYPGTEAYNWAVAKNYLKTEDFRQWLTEDGLHNCVIKTPNLSDLDLVEFCDRARREFYLRPSYIGKKLRQGLTDFYEFKRLVKGARSLANYLFKRIRYDAC
jgi:anaerobic magnesium-protoporphyrin IX monomethyl ester cyclase